MFFFGREIHKTLDQPVGLITTAWGGTRIQPWIPPQGYTAVPELDGEKNMMLDALTGYGQALANYNEELKKYAAAVKAAKPVLVWTVTPESKNAWRVSAFNKGDSHVQIWNTQLLSDDTATPVAQIKGMSYLLTGQKSSWMVTPNAAVTLGKKIKVMSQTDIGEQNATVQLANLHD